MTKDMFRDILLDIIIIIAIRVATYYPHNQLLHVFILFLAFVFIIRKYLYVRRKRKNHSYITKSHE